MNADLNKMIITKEGDEPFLITAYDLILLLKTGEARIYLKNDNSFMSVKLIEGYI